MNSRRFMTSKEQKVTEHTLAGTSSGSDSVKRQLLDHEQPELLIREWLAGLRGR